YPLLFSTKTVSPSVYHRTFGNALVTEGEETALVATTNLLFIHDDIINFAWVRPSAPAPSPPAPLPLGEGGRRPGEGVTKLTTLRIKDLARLRRTVRILAGSESLSS